MSKKKKRDWINDLSKRDLRNLDVAISKWLKLPEAEGFGKVTGARVASPWAYGPRVTVELSDVIDGEYLKLLFYFRKKVIGFNVVGVWTIKPRERIWPSFIEDVDKKEGAATAAPALETPEGSVD